MAAIQLPEKLHSHKQSRTARDLQRERERVGKKRKEEEKKCPASSLFLQESADHCIITPTTLCQRLGFNH